jgi:dipeptidyl aminopeptidase/acylaminoacyl peptidase
MTFGIYDVSSRAVSELLTVPAGNQLLGGSFNATGTRLALTLTNVVDRSTTRATVDGALLTSLVYQDVTGQLPPSQNPIVQNNVLYDFDLRTGTRREVRPTDEALFVKPEWNENGQVLKVQMYHPAQIEGRTHPVYTLQFVDRASFRFYDSNLQEFRRLDTPTIGYVAEGPQPTSQWFGPDEVLFNVPNGTNYHMWYYNLATGEFRNVTAGLMGSNRLGVAARSAGLLLFTHQSYVAPPALYKIRLDGTALERLTWENYELEQFSQTQMNPVSFQLASGVVRAGVLIQPAGAPFPPQNERIIIWQQGGPVGPLLTNRWFARVEDPYALLPNFGMSVLVVPLVGRRGLDGASYRAMADGTNFGQRDIDEMAEIVRQIHALGWTSPEKTGITGCSYGGYFTLQSLVRHSDLYGAANDQCALVDTFVEWTRGFDSLIPFLVGRPPYEIPDEYRADSPFYGAGSITTPLLTFKGDQDFLPVTLSENLFAQLAGRGLDVRFVKFMGEGHGLAQPQNELYAAQEQIRWFRLHLEE